MRADRRADRRYVEANRRGFASFRREGCSKPVSVVRSGKLWVCSLQRNRVFGPAFDHGSPANGFFYFYFATHRLYAFGRAVNTLSLKQWLLQLLPSCTFLRTLCFDHRVYFCGFYDS